MRIAAPNAEQLSKFPMYHEDDYSTGNPDLDRVYTHSVEAGWTKYWNSFGSVGLTAYYRGKTNEIMVNSPNPRQEVGEILFRGEHVMMGYYKNEEATKAAIDSEGWLHTGDLGLMDKLGNIYIKGRSKAMILTAGGQNIYPEELEAKLSNLPGVSEALVVGRNGKLVAFLQQINTLVAKYEQIAAIETVDQEFAKTPKRSIRRFLYK